MKVEYDIAIIGGGMVGASLACGLAKENINIALIEKTPLKSAGQPSYDDRGIALSISSQRIFDAMGLWSKLGRHACPIKQVHVSEQGRYGAVRMAADALGLEALGFVVIARELGRALLNEVSRHDNIDVICPASAAGIRQKSASVEVDLKQKNGGVASLTCKLLVIADGGLSSSRELIGIKIKRHDYRQTAIVSNVTVSGDHSGTAYERFVPGGLIALLPLTGNRCVAVMVAPSDTADAYLQGSDDEYINHLQQKFGKRLGTFCKPGARKSYPLFLLEPERQASDRSVLLGNAAHTIHPNGAQGFNLALRDVAGLVEHIVTVLRAGGDVGGRDLLDSYISSRETDQQRVIRFTHALHKTFNNANPLKSISRNTLMFVLDALPALKKEFIIRGAGLHVNQPVSTSG